MTNAVYGTSQQTLLSTNVTDEYKSPFYRNFLAFPAILKAVCLV